MKRGIDVSTYQKSVDWTSVRENGIDFAIIKATQGRSEVNANLRNFQDSMFSSHIIQASNAGIRCGVYHYLTAKTVDEAIAEAKFFLSAIKPYSNIIKLWSVVDVESKYLPNDKVLLTQIVDAFCRHVEASGYLPMVYTNPTFIKNRLNDITKWPLWLALWRNKTIVPTVSQYPNLRIWQWGSESVDGISGKVDANYMIVDLPEKKPEPEKDANIKSDNMDNTPSVWAKDAVDWAVENKILLGNEKGDLMLHQPMTREQACLVLKRLYNLFDGPMPDADIVAAEAAKKLINVLNEMV